jgi:adenylate kinase family enzyme
VSTRPSVPVAAGDPPLRRFAVIASASGCGKTTVGRAIAAQLELPFVELDALHHGPGWTEATADELRARVQPVLQSDAWVVDGGYWGKLGDAVLEHADVVVWLDLPIRVWLPRLLRRTFRRIVRKEELWAGNRETLRGAFVGRDALIPWALRHYHRRRRLYPERLAPFRTVRLRSQREVDRFLADL